MLGPHELQIRSSQGGRETRRLRRWYGTTICAIRDNVGVEIGGFLEYFVAGSIDVG